jgi:exopolysaccharide biosynthesis polyprenyl glycosylphosphotransferase
MKLALLDTGAVFAAALATLLLPRYAGGGPLHWSHLAAGGTLAVSLCTLVAFYCGDLYDVRIVPSFGRFVPRLPRSAGLALVVLGCGWAILPARVGEALFVSSLAGLALVVPLRAAAYAVMRRRSFAERLLVLGTSSLARKVVTELESRPDLPYQLVAVADESRLEDLDRRVAEARPDRIVVAFASRRGRLPVRQLLEFRVRGILLEDGAEFYERVAGKIDVESLTPSSLIFSREFRRSSLHPAVGRAVGLLLSAAGLILFAPVLALIALAIKLDSAGPVLFRQERVGLGGRRFTLRKFRTMRTVASHHSEWARDNGDRITRVGRWLRKFRLDEVPQLVNILRGDMNFVGPRPHPVTNHALFVVMLRNLPECGEQIPYYSLRSTVRPGLTGWAQVRYRYANDLEEEIEKMRYDLYYLKHRSLWLDLRILLDTVKIVLLGREQARTVAGQASEPLAALEAAHHGAA